MMKALLKRIAYVSPVTIVCLMFATMAYMDYSTDGDRVDLYFAIGLTALAILGAYFEFFHKPKGKLG